MNQEKRKALGRGLEALLPRRPVVPPAGAGSLPTATAEPRASSPTTTEAAAAGIAPASWTPAMKLEALNATAPAGRSWSTEFLEETNIQPGEIVMQIPLERINRNPYQTRTTASDDPALEELADSIKGHGVMQPVVVRPLPQPGERGELYQLIAGERRWLASHRAGKTHIPAIVREVPSEQVLILTIIENLHRQDLNPMQHARALERLAQDFRLTQEEVASRTGLARSAVANFLRLVRLPQELQLAVADGRLGFGQAKIIMSLEPSMRDLLARKIMDGNLTVRETEALVQASLNPKPVSAPEPVRVDPNVHAAEMELQRALGCRVQIKDRRGKGKITIEYKSLEDFDRILVALK